MQVNLNTNINQSRPNSKPNFGMKNNSNVAKKALEKTPVEIKDIIVSRSALQSRLYFLFLQNSQIGLLTDLAQIWIS